jgi:hypothetical protein
LYGAAVRQKQGDSAIKSNGEFKPKKHQKGDQLLMKNKNGLKRMFVILIALLSLAAFHLIGSGCDSGNYSISENSRAANGGGTLKSYAERQKDHSSPVKGNARTVTYRVYATYTPDANQRVESIITQWTVRTTYKRPISGSFAAGLTVGTSKGDVSVSANISASQTNEWQDLAITLDRTSTNGSAHEFYGPAEYVLFPSDQLYSHAVSNVARVKLSNHPTPTEVTVTA